MNTVTITEILKHLTSSDRAFCNFINTDTKCRVLNGFKKISYSVFNNLPSLRREGKFKNRGK